MADEDVFEFVDEDSQPKEENKLKNNTVEKDLVDNVIQSNNNLDLQFVEEDEGGITIQKEDVLFLEHEPNGDKLNEGNCNDLLDNVLKNGIYNHEINNENNHQSVPKDNKEINDNFEFANEKENSKPIDNENIDSQYDNNIKEKENSHIEEVIELTEDNGPNELKFNNKITINPLQQTGNMIEQTNSNDRVDYKNDELDRNNVDHIQEDNSNNNKLDDFEDSNVKTPEELNKQADQIVNDNNNENITNHNNKQDEILKSMDDVAVQFIENLKESEKDDASINNPLKVEAIEYTENDKIAEETENMFEITENNEHENVEFNNNLITNQIDKDENINKNTEIHNEDINNKLESIFVYSKETSTPDIQNIIEENKDEDKVFEFMEDETNNIQNPTTNQEDNIPLNEENIEELQFVDEGSNTNRDEDREIVVDDNVKNELFDFIDDKEEKVSENIEKEKEKSAEDYFNNNMNDKKLNVSISSEESSEEDIKFKSLEKPKEEEPEEVFNFCDEDNNNHHNNNEDVFEFVEEEDNTKQEKPIDDNEDVFEFVEEAEETNVPQNKQKNEEVFEFVEELVEEPTSHIFEIQNKNSDIISNMLGEYKNKMSKQINKDFEIEDVRSYSNSFISEFYFDVCPSSLSVSKINENLRTFKIEDEMYLRAINVNELLKLSQETNTKSEKLNNNFNSILKSIPNNTIHQLYLKLIDLKSVYTNKHSLNASEKKQKVEINFPEFEMKDNNIEDESKQEDIKNDKIEVDQDIFGMLLGKNIEHVKKAEPVVEDVTEINEDKMLEFLKTLKKPETEHVEDVKSQIQINDEAFTKMIDSLPNYKYVISKFVEYPDSLLNI
jgi:hypothetical protein